MKIPPNELTIRLALGLLFVGLLSACGQRGPLYLPDETQTERENRERAAQIQDPVIESTTTVRE